MFVVEYDTAYLAGFIGMLLGSFIFMLIAFSIVFFIGNIVKQVRKKKK